MRWEKQDATDSRWFSKTLEKSQEIQEAIDASGKSLWVLTTYEDAFINIAKILLVEGETVYFVAKGLSTEIPVRHIQTLTVDYEARKHLEGLPDLESKDAYLAAWTRLGSYKLNPRWTT